MTDKNKRPTIGQEVGEEIAPKRISYADRNTIKVQNRDPNFVYRVANSDDARYSGRVEELKAFGYTVCTDEILGDEVGVEGSSVGSAIGKPVGHGTRGVLMRIPKELYEEDQRAKQVEVDSTELGMLPEELLDSNSVVGEGLKINRPTTKVQH